MFPARGRLGIGPPAPRPRRLERDGRTAPAALVVSGRRVPSVHRDEALPWRQLTTGAFRVQTFPGGHFFVTSELAAVRDAAVLWDLAVTGSSTRPAWR